MRLRQGPGMEGEKEEKQLSWKKKKKKNKETEDPNGHAQQSWKPPYKEAETPKGNSMNEI